MNNYSNKNSALRGESDLGGGGGGNSAFSAAAKAIFRNQISLKNLIKSLPRSGAATASLAKPIIAFSFLSGIACLSLTAKAYAGLYPLASAGHTCSIAAGQFVSVTIGNMAKAPDITVPIKLQCDFDPDLVKKYITNTFSDGKPRGVGYCFHIHNTMVDFNYRASTTNQWTPNYDTYYTDAFPSYVPHIFYNFYAPGGRKIGGLGSPKPDQYNMIGWAVGSGTHYYVTDTITLRFENNEGRTIPAGDYPRSTVSYGIIAFHGGMSAVPLDLPVNFENPGAFCKAQDTDGGNRDLTLPLPGYSEATAAMPVTLSMKTYCNMSIRNQATFPTYASLRDVKPITATLNVDCSAGTHYRVTSDMGLHAIGNQRYMKAQNSDATISYNIDSIYSSSGTYTPDSAEPLREWTDYGNGTPAGINYDIQLSIPRQPTPPDDTYRDTIIYTLNHIPESGDVTNLNNMAGYTVQ